MALEAETAPRRPLFPAAAGGGGGEVVVSPGAAAAPVFLATETDHQGRPLDPVIWADEERMKRELLAWAKAVASMASASKNQTHQRSPQQWSKPYAAVRESVTRGVACGSFNKADRAQRR